MFCGVLFSLLIFIGACSDGSDRRPVEPKPEYDFSAVDAKLQELLDASDEYDGASYIVVDREEGLIYQTVKGDHTDDLVVMLAAVSRMPTTALLMAINDDESVDFDVEATIDNYLPWEGVYGDRKTVHLLSHTSGIPTFLNPALYGPSICVWDSNTTMESCGEIVYGNELQDTLPPETKLILDGPQWHLAGAVAEQVTNSSWRQAFDKYIAGPCEMEVMQHGNIVGLEGSTDWNGWTGSPDSLKGLDNPLMYGGAISNTGDMAKLMLMYLRDGKCGDTQIISEASLAAMKTDRTEGVENTLIPDWGYGLGWWITQHGNYVELGAFGSSVTLDFERGIGLFLAMDDYPFPPKPFQNSWNWAPELYWLVLDAIDQARAEVAQ